MTFLRKAARAFKKTLAVALGVAALALPTIPFMHDDWELTLAAVLWGMLLLVVAHGLWFSDKSFRRFGWGLFGIGASLVLVPCLLLVIRPNPFSPLLVGIQQPVVWGIALLLALLGFLTVKRSSPANAEAVSPVSADVSPAMPVDVPAASAEARLPQPDNDAKAPRKRPDTSGLRKAAQRIIPKSRWSRVGVAAVALLLLGYFSASGPRPPSQADQDIAWQLKMIDRITDAGQSTMDELQGHLGQMTTNKQSDAVEEMKRQLGVCRDILELAQRHNARQIALLKSIQDQVVIDTVGSMEAALKDLPVPGGEPIKVSKEIYEAYKKVGDIADRELKGAVGLCEKIMAIIKDK